MPDKFYAQEVIDRVVGYALAAARANQRDKRTIKLGEGDAEQTFNLRERGYCARFVRQVYETACGFKARKWKYAAADAKKMTGRLKREGHEVKDGSLIPGDIIGIHKRSGEFGHIAIYVGEINGKPTIAENTSSGSRGKPLRAGTKLTPYSVIEHRVTGVYRLLHGAPKPDWPDFRAFLQVGDKSKEIVLVPKGDHRKDQGKTYWKMKE